MCAAGLFPPCNEYAPGCVVVPITRESAIINAAMHTIIIALFFLTFDIKILNANDIKAIEIHPRELMQKFTANIDSI